jgi:tRNA pseudouridine38-40 synthase
VRYVLKLAYDGKDYCGWQSQSNAQTIQQAVEVALLRITREAIPIMGCGRTDTGVHAREFYAHFDWQGVPDEQFVFKLNNTTPPNIGIYDCFAVKENFHARFSATARKYEYHILLQSDPFLRDWAYYRFGKALNLEWMETACDFLLTCTNFQSFSKVNTDVKTFNCKLTECRFEQKDKLLVFHVKADRFLRNMVRAMVGTLLDIGAGRIDLHNLESIMLSGDRSKAGSSVPAKGLYLTEVHYPWEKYLLNE